MSLARFFIDASIILVSDLEQSFGTIHKRAVLLDRIDRQDFDNFLGLDQQVARVRFEQHSANCLESYFSDWLVQLPLQFCSDRSIRPAESDSV